MVLEPILSVFTERQLKEAVAVCRRTQRDLPLDVPLADAGVHPLRSLVTSVLSHFGPRTEVHIHFGL